MQNLSPAQFAHSYPAETGGKALDADANQPEKLADIIAKEKLLADRLNSELDGLKSELRSELELLYDRPRLRYPINCKQFSYKLQENEVGGGERIVRTSRSEQNSPSQLVLDLSLISELYGSDGIRNLRIGSNEARIAFLVDVPNAPGKLVVGDMLASHQFIEGPGNVHAFEWGLSEDDIYFTQAENLRVLSVHRFHIPSRELRMVYRDPNPRGFVSLRRSSDETRLFIQSGEAPAPVWHALALTEPRSRPRKLSFPADEIVKDIDHMPSGFYVIGYKRDFQPFLYSFHESPTISEVHKIVFPWPKTSAFPGHIRSMGENLVLANQALDGDQIELVDVNKLTRHPITSHNSGNYRRLLGGCQRRLEDLLVSHSSITEPPSLFVYTTDKKSPVKISSERIPVELGFRQDRYKIKRSEVLSSDATFIPLTLAVPQNDQAAGYILISYGAYGKSLSIDFAERYIPLLKRGIGIAMCHVRGGGELGAAWHDAGRKRQKLNSIEDYLACAKELKTLPGTSRPIVAYARSAGAITVARAAMNAPELFSGVILEAPFLDVIGQLSNRRLGLTPHEIEEWGDPNDLADLKVMREFSPYFIKGPVQLPPLLVLANLKDELISPLEGARWIAMLRRADSQGINPKIYHPVVDAVHSGVEYDYQNVELAALTDAFALWVSGLKN